MEKIGSERMASRGLVPLIFGRQTSPNYAATCIARLRAAFPKPGACEIKPFGGPNEMANMWKQTRYVQNANGIRASRIGKSNCSFSIFITPPFFKLISLASPRFACI